MEKSINYEKIFAERLYYLRTLKGVSAREMSLAIGQNPSYINRIENNKSFPSMQTFFYICEYLEITPSYFFDDKTHDENNKKNDVTAILSNLKLLSKKNLVIVKDLVSALVNK
ncbi:helix-turn-helix domain-containing protein [Eubacterium xylanophilum]|uniref:helix-turn-helix domain-containing protein n=1 Tax=Eubacterium xylanophilum TaxID=39497 RepID=UPI00055293B8|nr:helix-turn-helix transcriptional regulator [Eubacterium xylanophilum]